jgi:hypothetical protein
MQILMENRKNLRHQLLAAAMAWQIQAVAIGSWLIFACSDASAQRPRFPDPFQSQPVQAQPVQFQVPGATPPAVAPNNGLPSLGNPTFSSPPIITTSPPSSTLQPPTIIQQPNLAPTPAFDPFQSSSPTFPTFGAPGSSSDLVLPPSFDVLPPTASPQYQPNAFGAQPYGSYNQPPASASGWPAGQWPSQAWATLRDNWIPRVLERPRIRYTYITGDDADELGINDAEVATTLTIANFAGGTQPVRISPGFIFSFWDGPGTLVTGAELPAQAYSAYIATDYITDPSRPAGLEANVAIGMYSDFVNVSSDSWRITGTILGWRQVNSYSTAKLGIEYYDRVDIKLLPAIGVFMAPNPDLKFDIYFPRPKLAQRIRYFDRYQGWAYIGAEYGGGSWTVQLAGPVDTQVDINDVRAFVGAEWVGPRGVTGFFEFGYVFGRNLVYRTDASDKIKLADAYMIRTGIAF